MRQATRHRIPAQLTIYDPSLDPGRTGARRLAALLERVLADGAG